MYESPELIESNKQLDLTVIIPAYRAESTIAKSISSAANARPVEVIVVDDGSDDNTAAVAEAAGARCIRQENQGAYMARRLGASCAATTYLLFLDADDEIIPSAVRRSVELMEKEEDLVVAAGTVIGTGSGTADKHFPIRYSPVTAESLLINGFGPWPPCAAVVRRSAYETAERMSPSVIDTKYADDYQLLIRLSLTGRISVRDEATCRYELAGGKSSKNAELAIEAKEKIRSYYSNHLGISIGKMTDRDLSRAADVRVARSLWASGDKFSAAGKILKWILKDPRAAVIKLSSSPWQRN
ncbi:glycosyltransferase family 2 protein [Rhodococcus sp. AD45-ID]|uniref:glycosyltransferase family 2 protein n=1 Tax=unclassified Rhodococcus (in: high G+C Gram-positive bacteria) TaxID=192944 RepID=UPI0005D3E753|nr:MULTISPECIES: glycosyltransferase family 2 protein [unclassified Rhodococcus (in: high G+C Gram-positive bacteria)]KJF23458.1 Poly-beta-1,6-N-acetyl-D-glucosamine synthase [Rhodococcus sp. AD45]PSR41895.1 glycosyltransferase family 2 protein [Rhodococcus sp. AD45-ID]